jgi:hypothetical protein
MNQRKINISSRFLSLAVILVIAFSGCTSNKKAEKTRFPDLSIEESKVSQEQLTEQNPDLEKSHSLSVIEVVELLNGEWQPDCNYPTGFFRIEGKELFLDLYVRGACVLALKLDMIPTPADGETTLYFRSKEYLHCPLGTEEYADFEFDPENIAQDIPVGKLIPINEKKVEFSWSGLFDNTTRETLFIENLPFEKDKNGKIVLNLCE